MVTKRETKAAKQRKRVKDLQIKNTTVRHAKGVRGGFGASNPADIKVIKCGIPDPTAVE